jgi:hypothetical protein
MCKGKVAYGVVGTQLGQLPGIGAGDDRIGDGEIEESVTVQILVGTDKLATVLNSGDRRRTSERKQRQGGNDQGGREDHGEWFAGEEIR